MYGDVARFVVKDDGFEAERLPTCFAFRDLEMCSSYWKQSRWDFFRSKNVMIISENGLAMKDGLKYNNK